MTTASLHYPTLATALWPRADWRRAVMLALLGTAVLTISAKIQIPFWPVPMTMQTFAVLLIGTAFGWRLGGSTLLLYLAEGAVGLPVFAKGGGLVYMTGPTGGYLLGFLLAAVCVGWLAEKGWDRSLAHILVAMLMAEVLIFGFGLIWLGHLLGYDKAVAVGLTPFVAGEVFKIALATALLPTVWRRLGQN